MSDAALVLPDWNRLGGLTGSIVDRHALSDEAADAMFEVLDRCFAAHPREVFDADLARKDTVVLLHADDGSLKGFSTVEITTEEVDGKRFAVLFSGDTIVDPSAWGTPILSRCWLKVAFDARQRLGLPLYWLLICSGYRTYRFLPIYWSQFWPRHDKATPDDAQHLLDTLARRRFGEDYQGGVVRLPGGHLRPGIGTIDDARMQNPHIRFFAEQNPGHAAGDELVCLTELSPENLTTGGMRIYRAIP